MPFSYNQLSTKSKSHLKHPLPNQLMDNLQLANAKVLYVVSELWKEKIINDTEKITIKRMVVSNDVKIQPILELCEQEVDESSLRSSLLKLVKPQETVLSFGAIDESLTNNSSATEEVTSPLGNQLFERKKRHKNSCELNGLIGALMPIN